MKKINSAFKLIDDKHKASLLELKSNLMNSIVDAIKDNNITQKSAASIMNVTQPRVSDLSKGKISKFSFDLLFVMNERIQGGK